MESTSTPFSASTLPDLATITRSWHEASAQSGDQATALTREWMLAGMQWFEQGASGAEQWFATVGDQARRIAAATHEAAAKASGADDFGELWNAELELLGEATQMSAASAQNLWAAWLEQQSLLAHATLARGNGNLQRWLHTLDGSTRKAGSR